MGRNRDKSHKSDKDLREDHKKSSKSKEKHKNYSLQELKIRARNEEFDKIKDNYNKYENRRHRKSDHKFKKEEEFSDNEDKRQKRTKLDKNIDKSEEFWSKESKDKTNYINKEVVEKAKPNFEITGKLCEDTNTFNGVVIKYNEPLEARKPKRKWRLYPFKGEESLPFIPIHRQSAYLLGRDRKVADIPIDHPSCSKQHSVLQFRLVEYQKDDSTTGKRVRPYIIDLESSNGTFVNNQRIEPKRYYELFEKDVIKFGFSTREYVVLHEESKDENEDDDIQLNDEQKEVKNNDISN
jgi:smad nuclear-interacting protein 1